MWKLTNYKGEPVTWYSEEDMQKYKQALEKIKEIVTLDDINCKITIEAQSFCDYILEIVNNALKESEEK